jgi:lipid-A-disaccharide synthase
MKYFIIAGEQSGDLHGSNLVAGIFQADGDAEILCWGGDLMKASGAKLLMHYRNLAFMGFIAVLKNLGTIKKNLDLCKKQILEFNPDLVILIDYPGFNLRIAEFAKRSGIKNFYYISPKFWAWNEGRVKKVKLFTDRMFIIFPFEVDFYKKHGMSVEYSGNPLVDEIEKKKGAFPPENEIRHMLGIDEKPVIALLAGSRKHEIEFVLPQMVSMANQFPGYNFLLAGVKNISDDFYAKFIGAAPVHMIKDKTYEILHISTAALVTSGTATLETALIGIPQVVCYKAAMVEAAIAWTVIKVRFISLVNLIMGKEVVTELIQYKLNKDNLLAELGAILPGGPKRENILAAYESLKEKLGPAGASSRIAAEMVREIKKLNK